MTLLKQKTRFNSKKNITTKPPIISLTKKNTKDILKPYMPIMKEIT